MPLNPARFRGNPKAGRPLAERRVKPLTPQALLWPSAADLKSLTHSRQDRVSGTSDRKRHKNHRFASAPITSRSPRKGVAAMLRGLRKVGTSPPALNWAANPPESQALP